MRINNTSAGRIDRTKTNRSLLRDVDSASKLPTVQMHYVNVAATNLHIYICMSRTLSVGKHSAQLCERDMQKVSLVETKTTTEAIKS